MIDAARGRAFHAVNTELIQLYWRIGQYISHKLQSALWGEAVVDELAAFIARHYRGLRGFTRRNLFRMRQFYEAYAGDKIVSPLLTQLSWTHNLLILGRCKRAEARQFYLRTCARERWSSRELERQLDGCLFERALLNPPKVSAALTQLHPNAETAFKDSYALARSVSPALIAEYQTVLPDKRLLRRKLHEFYQLAAPATTQRVPPTRRKKTPKA
jgi:predicted nuclease of restriction endonuclease-like (RecB) superfamily